MIALVEGAERQKTPNEIALNILLAGLTIIFLLAVVTLQPFAIYSGAPQIGVRAGLAAGLPDSDDHRRPAVGDRHRRHGPAGAAQRAGDVRPRGRGGRRRAHAAARQDRHDHARQPPGDASSCPLPGVDRDAARRRGAARVAGRRDAGRALDRRAGQGEVRHPRPRRWRRMQAAFVPFTAQTRMSGVDLDGREIRKGAADAIERYRAAHGGRSLPTSCAASVERIARAGGTPLVVAETTARARRHPPEGHRQGRHPRALRRSCARWASRP